MPTTVNGSKHQRKNIKMKLKARKIQLRVVGSEKTGFRLAGEWNDRVVPIGQTFDRQTDAVQIGLSKYGTKAVKLTDSVRRKPNNAAKAAASLMAVGAF